MKKRNLKSLQLNKIAVSSLKGGSENAEETYPCEESIPFPQTHHIYAHCPSEQAPNTQGIGCVPHGPSVAGDC
ncbi:hypothetical protein IMCC3317_37610 [Kordia antarctica]|uniref:Uncharacterized protein n=1 Tax=Kordia antarctica TaxID=1218801 RepID=A0A7L4ZPH7_9FLAO|nr:hypothetical protein [Kordia antarctica]QHI38369.1 hypothetical protein IMCC3317_37610 [Kordia antarctica]